MGWGLKQSCSSFWELSNSMSHFSWRHRNWVDSWLLMVGNQIASLTLGPSFVHNLGCTCPNGSRKAILDIYTSRPFQRYKEHLKARCFSSTIEVRSYGSPEGLPIPTFGSVSLLLTLASKWGCDNNGYKLLCQSNRRKTIICNQLFVIVIIANNSFNYKWLVTNNKFFF